MNPQIKAIIAGTCFAMYPLILKHGKVNGNLTSVLFTFIVFLAIGVYVAKFAPSDMNELINTNWKMIIGAGLVSAIGMLFLTNMLSQASQQKMGLLIITMIVTQSVGTFVYQVAIDKGISATKAIGFACAAVAIVLLNKK